MARKSKTSKKLSKKLDKLEKRGDQLRSKAEKKGKELSSLASDRLSDLRSEPEPEKGGKGKFLLFILGAVGAVFALKRKRDQELDEALWEEPRSI
ncbi:MAG: hypothetical protein WEB09_02580 [Nitriliruptor sp.]